MEDNVKPTDSQILNQERECVLQSYSINGDTYSGYCLENARNFMLKNKDGKSIYTVVRNICDEDKSLKQINGIVDYPELYPHLQLPLGGSRNSSNTQELIFFPYYEDTSLEPLESVLFGKNMSLTQRFVLSLSIAAAISELESVFTELQIRQLRLNAFLVNMKNSMVTINCSELCENYTAEENATEYEKMAALGLMPPEWYEDKETFTITIAALRHLLAICIFRFICAEDPFDGWDTLQKYPYRGSEALSQIYGKNAKFILARGSKNPANNYIGWRAYAIFSAISPRLQKLFNDAFVKGIQDPSQRPSSKAWIDNQKYMISWFMVSGQEWRVVDLINGTGTIENTEYLVINNGNTVPLVDEKPLYQFMFDPESDPIQEKVIGKIQVRDACKKLIFFDAKSPEITLCRGKNTLPKNLLGVVTSTPWEMTAEDLKR